MVPALQAALTILGIAHLVFAVVMTLELYNEKGMLHALFGLCCCQIYVFIWGWMWASEPRLRRLMWIWTFVIVGQIAVLVFAQVVLGVSLKGRIGG